MTRNNKKPNKKDVTEWYRQTNANLRQKYAISIQNLHHKETLEMQERHHRELLQTQNRFNKKLLLYYFGMFAVAIVSLAYTIYSVNFQETLYTPKLTVQITDEKSPYGYGEYSSSSTHKVWEKYWNDSDYSMPLYVEINNKGNVPFQLYNIAYGSTCGSSTGEGWLITIPGGNKLIDIGKSMSFNDTVDSLFNTTVGGGLPCDFHFVVYGDGIVPIEKKIILIKD